MTDAIGVEVLFETLKVPDEIESSGIDSCSLDVRDGNGSNGPQGNNSWSEPHVASIPRLYRLIQSYILLRGGNIS